MFFLFSYFHQLKGLNKDNGDDSGCCVAIGDPDDDVAACCCALLLGGYWQFDAVCFAKSVQIIEESRFVNELENIDYPMYMCKC